VFVNAVCCWMLFDVGLYVSYVYFVYDIIIIIIIINNLLLLLHVPLLPFCFPSSTAAQGTPAEVPGQCCHGHTGTRMETGASRSSSSG